MTPPSRGIGGQCHHDGQLRSLLGNPATVLTKLSLTPPPCAPCAATPCARWTGARRVCGIV
eukprot:8366849-Pyramimonas_sp.AAC.2